MDKERVKIHWVSNQLTVTLDPNKPVPWEHIVEKMHRFLREDYKFPSQPRSVAQPTEQPATLTRPDNLNTNSPILTLSDSRKRSCPLLSLPLELFFEIFDPLTEPREVNILLGLPSTMWINSLYFLVKVFWEDSHPRKLMNLFHVSKAFREVAVSYYGEPGKFSPLFNPRRDKLVLRSSSVVDRYRVLAIVASNQPCHASFLAAHPPP
ncbi:hypothetical protein F4820DRAFT_451177 [Hypoxylon rubiginosum]|uniref:Uncharacterized protein n=1 Tax=Hypoxylon rubiginosum TaxID=110542 RepID=A0ACB9YSP0_9PEZI|nr:hypothetical protein F4820DRAFT_451177 [Hypoxylon rubiginosum]